MADLLRIGILGTGIMAQTMANAIRHVPGMTVISICSRDEARAKSIADALRIPASYGGLDRLLADRRVDIVYIANENRSHAEAAIKALQAGKAVLCEKPWAINVAEAQAIVAEARRSRSLIMEALATPFLPAVEAALGAAAAGELGRIRHFTADFGYPATKKSHPACYAPVGGGVLLDRAVYPVMLARLVLGPVTEVQARVIRNEDGIDVEASLLLSHANHSVSQIAVSLTALLSNSLTISGSKGSATVPAPLLAAEELVVRSSGVSGTPTPAVRNFRNQLKQNALARRISRILGDGRKRALPYGSSPYVHELMHFQRLFRTAAPESPLLSLDASLEVSRILEAARGDAR